MRYTLSFDLTGTLATFRFCNSVYFAGVPKLYADKYGLNIEDARVILKQAYDELGDRVVEWYDIKYWFRRFGLGTGWNNLLEELSHNIEFYPETTDVLARLSSKYELILITNACREFVEVETASIRKYFQRTISSVSDFGEVKKTPDFYAKVCRLLSRRPGEIIHVGDHWDFDYLAPLGYGLNAYFLDREGKRDGEYVINDLTQLESKLI